MCNPKETSKDGVILLNVKSSLLLFDVPNRTGMDVCMRMAKHSNVMYAITVNDEQVENLDHPDKNNCMMLVV